MLLKLLADLAEERGTYSTYEGSLWSKGILPIDSIELLQQTRGAISRTRSDSQPWIGIAYAIKVVHKWACAIPMSWRLHLLQPFPIFAVYHNRLNRLIKIYL